MKRAIACWRPLPCLASAAWAEWPKDRPIRVLVGFGAGGGTDIVSRIIAPPLAELLNQTVVVENKPAPAAPSPPRRSRTPTRTATPPR